MPGDRKRAIVIAIALAIAAYAVMLRLDAFVAKYGPLASPSWAAALTQQVAPLGASLTPARVGWPPDDRPYEGGDPINYLRYAREMRSFYQAHVREPVFLVLTRGFLWLLGGQDAAVSFASLAGSVLAVLGTFALARMLMSPIPALCASLAMAVDWEVITWAVDGWRDDTFMATVVWTAWAMLRLQRSPTYANAVVAGLCAAAACLTRITALTFVLPALAWVVLDTPAAVRGLRLRTGAVALLVMTGFVAPYLISCAVVLGDPLIAINYHTVYYRHGEGMSTAGTMSAAEYVRTKFALRPVSTFDTGFAGLFIQPFVTKWTGLAIAIGSGARDALVWCAAAGLLLMPFSAAGRLLLVVLLSSLLPYAFTWNVAGGDAWRFTMHVYPLYIVAAFHAMHQVSRLSAAAWRSPRSLIQRPAGRRIALAGAVLAAASTIAGLYVGLPWFVVREMLGQREDVSIETGPRDAVFYRRGWSAPHDDGVTVRVSTGERSVVHFPLPRSGRYDLILRIDPVAPERQRQVNVLVNGHYVARLSLSWDPQRVGSYPFRVQPDQVREGRNELVLIPDVIVPAASAGRRFDWLPGDARIGVRLWYVRVLPERPEGA
jgi:hypothetical protein